MPMPAVLTQVGTGIVIWTPDWMQNPFVVSIGIASNTAGANGTAQIDFTTWDINAVDVNGLATSTVATAWVNITAFTAAQYTSQLIVSVFTTPCQAFRLNVVGANATTTFNATFVQATFGR